MDGSPPKRRRISPRTSGDAHSSQADTSTSATRPNRPSFASPTKSSLSRAHPQILERRRSASASPAKPGSQPPNRPRRPAGEGEGSDGGSDDVLAQPRISTAKGVAASEAGRDDQLQPRDQAAEPSSGRSIRRLRGSLAASPRRSPMKPSPRPLPPHRGEEEDDLLQFADRFTRRRSPNTGITIPPRPEPELPPSVPDPISSTPPRGIHSSPLRWRAKRDAKKGSPLKQKPLRPDQENEIASSPSKRGRSGLRRSTVLQTASSSARNTRAYDPHAKARKKRDRLRQEVEKLSKELETAGRENERLRLMERSGRVLDPADEDEVMALLDRDVSISQPQPKLPLSQQLMRSALNPSSLLPFGKATPSTPTSVINWDRLPTIKSHHPVPMTAAEELPYLQLFSPFQVDATVTSLPSVRGEPLRQMHSIKLRSRASPGLFSAKIEMTVDAMDLTVTDLKVVGFDPASRSELEPFVNKICSGDCNRSMLRNVGIMSWAMAEWLRVAQQRAFLWSTLATQFAKGELEKTVRETRRKRKSRHDEDGDDDQDDVPSKADTLQYLGQQHFDVWLPLSAGSLLPPSARLEWKIYFDWTGEAQSRLGVKVGAQGNWYSEDEHDALGKLPKLFADLVDGGSTPSRAIRSIVALLAGEQD